MNDLSSVVDGLSWVQVQELVGKISLAVATFFVLFGGLVPYYFQYREILRTQNAKGFSLHVCLTLLTANITRILFWFGKHFEVQLLFQSVIMIACMLAMVEVTVRTGRKHILPPHKFHSIWEADALAHFWDWNDFPSFLICTSAITTVLGLLAFTFIGSPLFVEILGFVALLLEAMLGTPQLYSNWKRKSTVGMSVKMVLMWLLGDVTKTIYFVVRHTPVQFWLCGLLQIGIDIAILLQVAFYKPGGSAVTASKTFRPGSTAVF